ncbi:50S ribosomal protein L16 [Candidatus Calescamantes bacterium]|nr:50S ribosomal protein L16 [bacterium]MCK5223772.1 50S ribosomal protein L16 [Candidatus Calescamantes bacterium]MCK5398702.1 50S ribosomal protein L16 [bacterium]MCK5598440.1 50S ribosomal protein L16 [bacterium]
MLMPRKSKFRKMQKGRIRGHAQRGNRVSFGEYGIQTKEHAFITANEIESVRVNLNKKLRKIGKIWIRIFPQKVLTSKPLEVRMGKGKGAPDKWVAAVKPGHVLFEISGVDEVEAKRILKQASYKLSVKTNFIKR